MRKQTSRYVLPIGSEGQRALSPQEEEVGGERRRVSRKFLARGKAEEDHLDLVVIVERAAEGALFRNLHVLQRSGLKKYSILFSLALSSRTSLFPDPGRPAEAAPACS